MTRTEGTCEVCIPSAIATVQPTCTILKSSSTSGYVPLSAHVEGHAFHATLFARGTPRADDVEFPAKRTLFSSMPPSVGEADILAAFEARAGEVSSVRVSCAADARTAHVVFALPAGLKKALALTKPLELGCSGSSSTGQQQSDPHASFMSESAIATRAPAREALQAEVGEFMERFEAEETARREEEDARHNQMDSDGFVVVTRKRAGRSTTTDTATGATVNVATAGMQRVNEAVAAGNDDEASASSRRKKKRAKEMTDFYHFQAHEKKREGLLRLREQFEADRERIAKMRADRKFKPQGY